MSSPSTLSLLAIVGPLALSACSAGFAKTSGGGVGSNHPPVAVTGPDREVFASDLVTLIGTASSDPDGDPLTWQWELRSIPAGSQALLDDPASAKPTFFVDRIGDYVARLVVDDGIAASAPAEVRLHAVSDESLRVGPTRALRVPSEAVGVAQDGAMIRIDAGTYRGDVAVWTQDGLRLTAAGGPVVLLAEGQSAQGKAIWVVQGDDTTVEGITFEGCQVNDGNGAGIRLEGGNFTARDCRFMRNQMGFLCGNLGATDLLFEGCEFGFSQSDEALAHGVYVNRVRTLEMRHCFVHDASRGHCIKSRAERTRILWCRVGDFATGSSSYVIDLPDGGLAHLVGNVIHKGVSSQNEVAISFGEEHGGVHPIDELHAAHNTVVIDRSTGAFVRASRGRAELTNNIFCGPGPTLIGAGSQLDNLESDAPGFADRGAYDFRLAAGSPATDAGLVPGTMLGIALMPAFEYRDVALEAPRIDLGSADLGAFAFVASR